MHSFRYNRLEQFLFASITDCITQNTITDPIWLRGMEYKYNALPVINDTIPPEATSLLQTRKRYEILNTPAIMPRVSLAD